MQSSTSVISLNNFKWSLKMKKIRNYSTKEYIAEYTNLINELLIMYSRCPDYSERLRIEQRIYNIRQGIRALSV